MEELPGPVVLVTLAAKQPMRRCGRRWATQEEAQNSKKGLTGYYLAIPCRCGGWHLQELVAAMEPRQLARAPKHTGPTLKVRLMVLNRDRFLCARCGRPAGPGGVGPYSIQHRVARGSGGTSDPDANSMSRLLLLCGSATTGCHGEVEKRGDEDNAKGYWLWSWQDPEAEGVMYASADGGFTAWLEPDGGLSFEPPEAAA
jgi:hypothetical protein